MSVRILTAAEFGDATPRLAEILQDAVDDGAGVSFLAPLAREDALAFWRGLSDAVASGQTIVFVAEVAGEIAGCVLLLKAWQPNQPHRCDIAKLLVHRDHRRRKLGTALIHALETEARRLGLKLVTFDAVAGGPADTFYQRLGFTRVGVIPGYAYSGRGQLDGTAIFYKEL
jgi:GNAT superfamily N-acetyltransferase